MIYVDDDEWQTSRENEEFMANLKQDMVNSCFRVARLLVKLDVIKSWKGPLHIFYGKDINCYVDKHGNF